MQTEARVGVLVEGGGQRARHQQRQHQPKIDAAVNLVAGGVAGAVSKTFTAPLARLTILFQIQGMHSDVTTLRKASILREASRIVSEEGFRAFWKGNLVTIAHRLPYTSISFHAYDQYKNLLQSMPGLDKNRDSVSADVCVRLLGGGLAGITAASMTYPLDLVRTRLAAQTNTMYYKGISHALYAICRDEGIRGLYKGLGATLLGVGPNIAISYSVYETTRSYWQVERPYDSPALVSLACGSFSGIASSTVCDCSDVPFGSCATKKAVGGVAGRANVYRTGIYGTFQHIVRNEGFRGLYRGILPEYYKVVPTVGIVFMTYEMLKSIMSGM